MRRSPPPGYIYHHSLTSLLPSSSSTTTTTPSYHPTTTGTSDMAAALRALADHIESHPRLLSNGTYSLALDFLGGRIPPHPSQLPPRGKRERGRGRERERGGEEGKEAADYW